MTTKLESKLMEESLEKLRGGMSIEQVLGSIAYEHGRAARDTVAIELKRLVIKGADSAAA